MTPQEPLYKATQIAKKADLCLVLGSSMQVLLIAKMLIQDFTFLRASRTRKENGYM